jgi:helitron helicase-like protein
VQEDQVRPPNNDNNKFVSLALYFHYCLHICPANLNFNHLFLAGKLFQEYIYKAWAVAEQKCLGQLKHIQDKLRAEIYQGLADTIAANADINLNNLGQCFILPLSFIGGTCHMQQQCQDALAINCHFGGEDLFITITANPSWPEIQDTLFEGQTASDHPDLVV